MPALFSCLPQEFASAWDPTAPWSLLGDTLDAVLEAHVDPVDEVDRIEDKGRPHDPIGLEVSVQPRAQQDAAVERRVGRKRDVRRAQVPAPLSDRSLRRREGVIVAAVLVPAAYQVFAVYLRVPLPWGSWWFA